ncbi:PP2C family protein-serine/threonine phosphatase [Nocardioides marinquilinus]|uniref:PP2C family protein-serine/threonine phosphatase n=1 Tax=Nocardioides marinquilinus TaxID=1210400 RepID=A0ABP9PYU8_9ACTN
MTSITYTDPTDGPRGPGRPQRARSASLRRRLRRAASVNEYRLAAALVLFSLTVAVLVSVFPERMPFSALTLPVVVGSIMLGPRTLPWFVVFDMAVLTFCVSQQIQITPRTVGAVVVMFTIALVVLLTSFRRARLGVTALRGETMFIDLRDRILHQGYIPELPDGWLVESALHSAGGTAFAGDFVVASRSRDGASLSLVVVDVSGKGQDAGTRALLLSGAMGGLLSALPPADFLPAANDYLLRQDWDEGFATAVHLHVHLATGDYEVRAAGHPPPAHRRAGTGGWTVLHTEGPVLGLVPDAEFVCVSGHLESGDSVLLYTDGMVEEPSVDIEVGIERMIEQANSLLRASASGAAARLAGSVGSKDDDRAMLVVNRD